MKKPSQFAVASLAVLVLVAGCSVPNGELADIGEHDEAAESALSVLYRTSDVIPVTEESAERPPGYVSVQIDAGDGQIQEGTDTFFVKKDASTDNGLLEVVVPQPPEGYYFAGWETPVPELFSEDVVLKAVYKKYLRVSLVHVVPNASWGYSLDGDPFVGVRENVVRMKAGGYLQALELANPDGKRWFRDIDGEVYFLSDLAGGPAFFADEDLTQPVTDAVVQDSTVYVVWNRPETKSQLKVMVHVMLKVNGMSADLNYIDTGRVNDMSHLFRHRTFVPGAWRITNPIRMRLHSFNGKVDKWDTSSVTDMSGMFADAQSFNRDLSNWDTSKVTNMKSMFIFAWDFDNAGAPMNTRGKKWDTSQVTDMASMFGWTYAFNRDIGNWDTGKVESMSSMFADNRVFDQNLGSWNTSKVRDMSQMFNNARAFTNGGASMRTRGLSWNTGNVEDMKWMFADATAFNQDIGNWDTGKVESMQFMFTAARNFDQDIGGWNTGNVKNMYYMFSDAGRFNQDIGQWKTGNVEDMHAMFQNARAFDNGGRPLLTNGDSWDVGQVGFMLDMFKGAVSFNQEVGNWNTEHVKNMNSMFMGARLFNRDVSGWNVDSVTDAVDFSQGSALEFAHLPVFR